MYRAGFQSQAGLHLREGGDRAVLWSVVGADRGVGERGRRLETAGRCVRRIGRHDRLDRTVAGHGEDDVSERCCFDGLLAARFPGAREARQRAERERGGERRDRDRPAGSHRRDDTAFQRGGVAEGRLERSGAVRRMHHRSPGSADDEGPLRGDAPQLPELVARPGEDMDVARLAVLAGRRHPREPALADGEAPKGSDPRERIEVGPG